MKCVHCSADRADTKTGLCNTCSALYAEIQKKSSEYRKAIINGSKTELSLRRQIHSLAEDWNGRRYNTSANSRVELNVKKLLINNGITEAGGTQ